MKKQYTIRGIYNLGARDGMCKMQFAILIAKKLKLFHNNYECININKLLKVKNLICLWMLVNLKKKFNIKLPINQIRN